MAPILLAAPSCCGLPLAGFLGTAALPLLVRATPWLLLGTALALAASLVGVRRRLRPEGERRPGAARGPRSSPPFHPAGLHRPVSGDLAGACPAGVDASTTIT